MLLDKYLPSKAVPLVDKLIAKYPSVRLLIVDHRASKRGDFRSSVNGKMQISINNSLNQHEFLLTLIHEFAHLIVFKKFGNQVQPHGKEWKMVFKKLMLPFLTPKIYPQSILPHLVSYMENPKASTDADANLSLALINGKADAKKNFIYKLPVGSVFEYKNTLYKKGEKKRTRYTCLKLSDKSTYLFTKNTQVILKTNTNFDTGQALLNIEKKLVYELPIGSIFEYKNTLYRKGEKRRTRYACLKLSDKSTYLFNQNTQVILKAADNGANTDQASNNNCIGIEKSFIFELPIGSVFEYKNRFYQKGEKRKTRYICLKLDDKSIYHFGQNTQVVLKANSDTNLNSSNWQPKKGLSFIFELPIGSTFEYKNTLYQKGEKRRTRYVCIKLSDNSAYLFRQNALVTLKTDTNINFYNNQLNTNDSSIHDLPIGSVFEYKNTLFKKNEKKGTRYACVRLYDKTIYLFYKNTRVVLKKLNIDKHE
ncbi:MAG: SprT-like domain-containing protein [Tenacibaculum sp.]